MLISETVIWDMLTNAFTPASRATAAMVTVTSRYPADTDMPKWTRPYGQLGSCVSFLGTGSARLIGSGLRIPTMKILGGNKGALRIPSLSFQLLRRPGCTAKLLCFQ